MHRTLLEGLLTKIDDKSADEHERYLMIKVIGMMEDDMDLARRTTRCEMLRFSRDELVHHFEARKAIHRHSWTLKRNKL